MIIVQNQTTMASNQSSTAIALFATNTPQKNERSRSSIENDITLPPKLSTFPMKDIEGLITKHQQCVATTGQRLEEADQMNRLAQADLQYAQTLENSILTSIDENNRNMLATQSKIENELTIIAKLNMNGTGMMHQKDLDDIIAKY